jgi:hypothetical protein
MCIGGQRENSAKGNCVVGCGLGLPGSGQGPVVGSCECGNEILDSIKSKEFLN